MDLHETIEQVHQSPRKYIRTHLKPIAKSIYNNRETSRVNGSLNGAVTSSGVNIMERDAKALTTFGLQS